MLYSVWVFFFFYGRTCAAVLPCELLQLVQDQLQVIQSLSTSVATVFPVHAEDKTLYLFTTVDLSSYLIINGMGALSENLWVETV